LHFEFVHEFDIPLDALELAVLSPDLVDRLRPRLSNVESLTQRKHSLENGMLSRVWAFQANVKVPKFAQNYITKEMCAWDETSSYDLRQHTSEWSITPNVKAEWQKYFSARGTYALAALGSGRTKRVVTGDCDLNVPLVRPMAEKLIVGEVRKMFEAEADTLRDLATLV